jgi:hypothetical protein
MALCTASPGGVFVVCEAAGEPFYRRVEAAAAQAGGCHDNRHHGYLHISRRVDVIPKQGLPPLFSVRHSALAWLVKNHRKHQ